MPTASATSSTRAATIDPCDAPQLERKADLVAHPLGRERLARLLQDDADALRGVARRHGGPAVADHLERARDGSAVEVRQEAAQRPQHAWTCPIPSAPDTTVRVPGASTSSSMRAPHSAPRRGRRVAPRALDGRLAVARHGACRRTRAARGRLPRAVARARVRSSTGASTRGAAALAAQALREAHRAHGIGERRERPPRDGERPRDAPAAGRAATPRANSRGRSRSALSRPKARIVSAIGTALAAASHSPPVVTGPNSTTCANGGGSAHRGKRQDDGARAVGAVEEDAVDDPDHDEPGGESRRGAQGSGSQRHGLTRSARRARRSG